MVLAEYGFRLHPKTFTDVSGKTQELQEWLGARRKIIEALRLEYQRLEHNPCQKIKDMIDQTIEHFKVQQKLWMKRYKLLLRTLKIFH